MVLDPFDEIHLIATDYRTAGKCVHARYGEPQIEVTSSSEPTHLPCIQIRGGW
jgi:hypothetical protein